MQADTPPPTRFDRGPADPAPEDRMGSPAGAGDAELAAPVAEPSLGPAFQHEHHEMLRASGGAATRAILMAAGVSGATVLTHGLLKRLFDLSEADAVFAATFAAIPIGVAFAWGLILRPERRAARDRQRIIDRIEAVAAAEREAPFDALLKIDPRHELAELARTIHSALASAHRHRLEAARLKREMNARIERETRRQCAYLATLSFTDELTGLANRRGFERGLEVLYHRAVARGDELALLAIDLDHFKLLNDTCGHDKGDEALAIAGDLLQAHTREGDLAGRCGGDELFVALYNMDAERATRVAERLIDLFARHPAGLNLPCKWPGMSIGIALLQGDRPSDVAEFKRMADRALYASKRGGRSRATPFGAIAA